LDPLSLPVELQTALEALYGHYEKTFELWQDAGIGVPPVLHRRLQQHVHLQAGLRLHLRVRDRVSDDGSETTLENGRLALFRNYDEHGNRCRGRTPS
jgi:type III restriction enzyme